MKKVSLCAHFPYMGGIDRPSIPQPQFLCVHTCGEGGGKQEFDVPYKIFLCLHASPIAGEE